MTKPAQENLQLATPDGDTTNVEKYEFEPIKGYPMLNWRGKRPFTSTQYYPAQLKEVHGEEVDGWRNKIFWGDNLQVMSHLLKEFRGKVDLVYIDPPFDSKADYKKKIALRGNKVTNDGSSFEDKQYSDIWSNDEYLQFMYERLVLIRELMAESGSIVLHADYHKAHLLRCILDEVFGIDNFRNEIIIRRPITKNLQAQFETINALSTAHDNLFFYSKSTSTRYKQAYDAYNSVNEDGYWHRFWSGEDRPTMRYKLLGVSIEHGQWKWAEKRALIAHENYQEFLSTFSGDEESKLVEYWREKGEELEFLRKSSTGTVENWYPPATQKLANTLWLSCKAYEIQKQYPTQKHEELLSLILERFSEKGHIVFDCFMGSGTTQAVAIKLGRRFIGADINLGAIQTSTKRLIGVADDLRQKPIDGEEKHFTGFELLNVNHYDVFRNPVQAKELLIEALEIQKLEFSTVFDGEKDGRMVKIMPVNRIATRADLNELIAGFDYKAWERKQNESPNRPVEKITLVCMGHEPDLAATLVLAAKPFKIDVEVVDILRDKADLEFKRDSQAKVSIKKGRLVIEIFYPMNLLQKLSLQKEAVEDWRELTESVLIDWNYDGAVLQPTVVDIPGRSELVKGEYDVPEDAATIRVKITDLLSESWEGSLNNGG